MPLVSSAIPNFVNGVSQQPYTLRLSSQGEVQENGLSSVAQGLKKRPPTEHVKKILSTSLDEAFVHTINRDLSEQYIVVVTDGDLKVFDLQGVEQTVSFPSGKGYLDSTNASEGFSAVTVADYTFIVNKQVVVEQSNLLSATRPYEALVNVKQGNYGKTYSITVNGVSVASFTTPDGSTASHVSQISTDYIANQLFTQANTNLSSSGAVKAVTSVSWKSYAGYKTIYTTVRNLAIGSTGGTTQIASVVPATYYTGVEFTLPAGSTVANTNVWINGKLVVFTPVSGVPNRFAANVPKTNNVYPTSVPTISARVAATVDVERKGSVLYFYSNSSDFTIDTSDGFNMNAMLHLKGRIQNFADLPQYKGFDGVKFEVAGEPDSPFDNYWVEYDADFQGGVWKETVAPNIPNGMFAETMPHALVRQSDGTFVFYPIEWGQRTAGDEDTAPEPSFVGKVISDVLFYRNRLGFLADEALCLSEAGEFFNFFPTTVTQLLDSDRIDVTVSHTKVANLKHGIPFNKQLILFSEQTQFVVEDTDLLTPKSISVKVASEFPCNVNAKPTTVGRNMYFTANRGEWSLVREYFPDSNNYGYDSLDITGHLPRYIPSDVFKLTSSPNEDTMVGLSAKDRSSIYVYKFFFNNSEKLQSSWSKWTLGDDVTILNADFILSDLILVVSRPDGVYIEKVNVALGNIAAGEDFNVLLDRKRFLTPANLSYSGGFTIITPAALGYTPDVGEYQAVVNSGNGFTPGVVLDVVWDGANAKVAGNYSTANLSFGRKYIFKYTLSTITMKAGQQGNQRSYTEGRLQLRKLVVNFADTGYFHVLVTPSGRSTSKYVYSGKVIGQLSGTIGESFRATDRFLVPVISRNIGTEITLINDSPFPSNFLSADWEGYYHKRSSSV